MVKSDTLLVLGGLGLAGYLIFKSDIAKNIGEVGEGVGEAVGGLGSGIGTIGREVGDVVVDVGSVFEPFGQFFQGAANSLRREQNQQNQIDVGAFEENKDVLIDIQGDKDINKAQEKLNRSMLIQDQLTDVTRGLTQVDEFVVSGLRNVGKFISSSVIKPPSFGLGAISAQFAKSLRKDNTKSLNASPSKGGSIVLPTNNINFTPVSSSSSSGGSSRSSSQKTFKVRSSGITPINFTPVRNFTPVSSSSSKSVRSKNNTIKSKVSGAVSKAKSLLRRLF